MTLTNQKVFMTKIRAFLSALNKARKKNSPYVTRRRYDALLNNFNLLKDSITSQPNPLSTPARLKWEKEYQGKGRELCLFVSYTPKPKVKSYVAHYIQALKNQGIDVILILNTDFPELPIENLAYNPNISGLCIRENKGFDFGAWSQVMAQVNSTNFDRIYWVNDSLFGPLKINLFDAMIDRIKQSKSDLVGLTKNGAGEEHLQSFFLVFNKRLLENSIFWGYVTSLWSFPTKSLVIEFYELRLTRFVKDLGFSYEALFSLKGRENQELMYYFPRELVESGFPFVKTALIKSKKDEGVSAEFLPQHLPIE